MNGNDIIDALESVDTKLISRAEKSRGKSRLTAILGVCAAAAALTAGAVMLMVNKPNAPEKDASAVIGTESVPTDEPGSTGIRKITEAPETVEISEDEGCFLRVAIYKGRAYSEYGVGINPEKGIEDEHIGRANVLPEDWRDPEGYVEFMGDFGDYFTVKGVDPRFMICTKGSPQSDDMTYILINSSSVDYENGADLLEDMLHLSETEPVLTFESIDSWNNHHQEIFELLPEHRGAVSAFVKALDESEWAPFDSVYNKPRSYHINLKLACGIGVDLMLHPDGYVGVFGIDDRVLDVGVEAVKSIIALLDDPRNSACVGVFPGVGYSLDELQAIPKLGEFIPDLPKGYFCQNVIVRRSYDEGGSVTGFKWIQFTYEGPHYLRATVVEEDNLGWVRRANLIYEPSEVTEERLLADAKERRLYFAVRFDDVYLIFDDNIDSAADCVKLIESIVK